MKTRQIFWGAFLISIGALILLRNFIQLELEWGDLWKIWPIVLVLIGINIIIKNNLAKSIISAASGLLLAFALYASVVSVFGLIKDGEYHFDTDEATDYEVSNYTAGFEKGIKMASLQVEAGAGSFELSDTTRELFNAQVEGKSNSYTLTSHVDKGSAEMLFKMKSKKFYFKQRNRVEFKLNPVPAWNLKFDIGAAEVNFDFSSYLVNNLDIQMGAAALTLKLGDLNKETHVNIDAGASSIDIEVPENAGCEIAADVSLSSKDFQGFSKYKGEIYRTDNFDKADKKIYIDLQSGVSSIKISRESW